MVPQLQHWTAKPNTFVYVFHVALEHPYKLINVILVLSKTKGREILYYFFFNFTLSMFIHDFVGFSFFCTMFVYVVCFLMQLTRCLYVRDYFDDTFISSKLKILFL